MIYSNPCTQRVLNDAQAFLRSYDSAPHPPRCPPLPPASCLSFSVFLCVAGEGPSRVEGEWWARCQIIRRRESLALYKSFNTLCLIQYGNARLLPFMTALCKIRKHGDESSRKLCYNLSKYYISRIFLYCFIEILASFIMAKYGIILF